MTPMWASRAMVSSHMLAVSPSGAISQAMASEKNAPDWYGKSSSSTLTAAPRNTAKVRMTRKIITRMVHAPPLCEP